MYQLIVALDENYGLGKDGSIPWNCSDDRNLYKKLIKNTTIIVGGKTYLTIPKQNYDIICLSKTLSCCESNGNTLFVKSPEELKSEIQNRVLENKNIFSIIGGMKLYEYALTNNMADVIHLSIIKGSYNCDMFFPFYLFNNWQITEHTVYDTFDYYVLKKGESEQKYLDLLKEIINKGDRSNGRNGVTLSLFKNELTFNLQEGFPLITTKKMFTRGILEELFFFIRGDTDTNNLSSKNINIWKGNTTREFLDSNPLTEKYAAGVMGPMYGAQWVNFGAPYVVNENGFPVKQKNGVNQIENVIKLIKEEPNSRRIIMTTYNPSQTNEGVLFPCHGLITQFYVKDGYLDMFTFCRSSDMFLGIPFNIASYAFLLSIIAKITEKKPRFIHITMGDCHIYEEHIEQCRQQWRRIPYKFPSLEISKNIKSYEDMCELTIDDFIITEYKHHPSIKAEMIV